MRTRARPVGAGKRCAPETSVLLVTVGEVIEELDGSALFYLGGAGAPESDPELEAAGLRLTPHTESAVGAAARISGDLARAR